MLYVCEPNSCAGAEVRLPHSLRSEEMTHAFPIRVSRVTIVVILAGAAALTNPTLLRADPNPSARQGSEAGGHSNARAADDIALLDRLSNAYSAIAEEVQPSVVSIRSLTVNEEVNDELKRMFGDEDFQPVPMAGTGSGIILDTDGYIVTNNHVVEDAGRVQVTLHDGRDFLAEVIGTDRMTDIAVIRIDAKDLHPCRLGDSDSMRVGNIVLAIGSPFKFGNSVSHGIISATGRTNVDVDIDYKNWLQTDAPINPGNSGGPLINTRAEVIGMSVAIATESGGYQGVGFAIPSNMIRRIANVLKAGKKVVRGYLGVEIKPVNRTEAEVYGLDAPRGALLGSIFEDSPAAQAGLQSEDIILGIDGRQIRSVEDLQDVIAFTQPGTKTQFSVWRGRAARDVTVEIGKQPRNFRTSSSRLDREFRQEEPEDEEAVSRSDKPVEEEQSELGAEHVASLGLYAATLTPELSKRFRVHRSIVSGALITMVDPLGEAFAQNIRRGFVIQKVNDIEIETMNDLKDALNSVKNVRGVRMELRVGRDSYNTVVRLR